jgi:transposase-like protein
MTQVMYRYLPVAVFEHEDYGLCKVTSVIPEQVDVNRDALFDAMADALAMWTNPEFIKKFPDPRDAKARVKYSVGSPREVRFVPYPETFICRKCRHVARFADLLRRNATATGTCARCGGTMNRLRYVQAHNCGRMEEVFIPPRCPKCKQAEHVTLFDPGRVKGARWYCSKCKTDIQSLRSTPCRCAYNDTLPAKSPERFLKVVPTADPSLYLAHTAAFINFPETSAAKLRTAPSSLALMLARGWGLLSEPVETVVSERERVSKDSGDPKLAALIERLRKLDPEDSEVKAYDAERGKPKGQDAVDAVAALLGTKGSALAAPPWRWLIEYVTLLDKTSLSTTGDVVSMLRRRGDESGAKDVEEAEHKARSLLGIDAIRVINDFPLTLSTFGYTRTSRDPARTILNSFPVDERSRIPVFALSTETEAIWFQLDPVTVVQWLIENGLGAGVAPKGAANAWAWLYANVPGLRESPYETNHKERSAVAIRTLLHTMSHVFLRRIEWSGFAPASVSEYLLPGALSFILYANRIADTKIGGLTTLFEQRLNTWLWDAVQAGHECIYDPICGDDGGSCAGCTHREHNCIFFNRELSRATLYGGPTPQTSDLQGMLVRRGYWHGAWMATPTE